MQKIKENYNLTMFSCYIGYFVQAIINNLAPLLFLTFQNSFGFTYGQISSLILLNFVVQLFVDLFSAFFIDKIGYRRCIVTAHFFAAAGLIMLGTLPFVMSNAYVAVVASILFYAAGSGLIEVIISPLAQACPTKNKSAAMSVLHSFYCWGQVCVIALSTLFFSLAGLKHWRIVCFLWALVPPINAVLLMLVPFPEILSGNKGIGVKALIKNRQFILCAVVMFCAGASELSMSQWASAFAESGLHVSKSFGDLLGPCMFAVLMGTARVLYAKFSGRISLEKFMLFSGLLCVASYLLTSLSPWPLLSLFACAVCGFSVGVMWPGTFSFAADTIPEGGTAMFALLALFGDLGCALGPVCVGTVASAFSNTLSKGLLLAAVFPLILVLSFLFRAKKESPTGAR